MEDENGNGATWDGEKWEQEIERVIHLAGGGVKISKVENEAGRWREMVQIGETRWRKRGRCMLGGKCCKRFGGKCHVKWCSSSRMDICFGLGVCQQEEMRNGNEGCNNQVLIIL